MDIQKLISRTSMLEQENAYLKAQLKKYIEEYGQLQLQGQLVQPQKPRHFQPLTPTNIYAPDYAQRIGVKPRATTSANIGMGGVKKNMF
jgi:hypothetical protein